MSKRKSPPNKLELVGKKFGMLTVEGISDRKTKNQNTIWWCLCECGVRKEIVGPKLTSGERWCCGCKSIGKSQITHGMTETREYGIWTGMIQRCCNPNVKAYNRYGGRGITVCDKWKNSFEEFYKDMGPCPDKYQIERVNNDAGYSPDNCKWSSVAEQSRNTSQNVNITFNGETKCLSDWAKHLEINKTTLLERIGRWGVDLALSRKGKWHKSYNKNQSPLR